jgi:hypothetical protein
VSDVSSTTAQAHAPAVERVEHRLRVLEEISETGMEMLRTLCVDVVAQQHLAKGLLRDINGDKLSREALDGAAAMPKPRDPAGAFGKLSRAIRLTLTVEARTDEALLSLLASANTGAAALAEAKQTVIRRMDRRLRLLQEVSTIGLRLVRILCVDVGTDYEPVEGSLEKTFHDRFTDEAFAAGAYAVPSPHDRVAAYCKLSRAIRLTLALEERTDQAQHALRCGLPLPRMERAERRAKAQRGAEPTGDAATEDSDAATDESKEARDDARVELLRDIVREAAETEVFDRERLEDIERTLDERLEGYPTHGDLADLPFEEVVRLLCAELGLQPDWRRWNGRGWSPRQPSKMSARSGSDPPAPDPSHRPRLE